MRLRIVVLSMMAMAGCASDQERLIHAQARIEQLRAEVVSLRAENERLRTQVDQSTSASANALKVPEFTLAVPIRPKAPSEGLSQMSGNNTYTTMRGEGRWINATNS